MYQGLLWTAFNTFYNMVSVHAPQFTCTTCSCSQFAAKLKFAFSIVYITPKNWSKKKWLFTIFYCRTASLCARIAHLSYYFSAASAPVLHSRSSLSLLTYSVLHKFILDNVGNFYYSRDEFSVWTRSRTRAFLMYVRRHGHIYIYPQSSCTAARIHRYAIQRQFQLKQKALQIYYFSRWTMNVRSGKWLAQSFRWQATFAHYRLDWRWWQSGKSVD